MKLDDLVLRCYAEREEDGSWFAICLYLNIYARGNSAEEVKARLRSFVREYLKEAVTKDREHFSDLVPRRAPAYFWARYFRIWCYIKFHQTKDFIRFKMSLPLVPA